MVKAGFYTYKSLVVGASCFLLAPYAACATEAADNALPDTAGAQRDSQPALQDIIVTAQRQAEKLQNVPIAVTALTGSQLAASGITSNVSLEGAIPNLTMSQLGTAVKPFLRGVGSDLNQSTDEPAVATYIDGFYNPQIDGNFFNFTNVERIEVLKGPQGTLFGRNATGGVIQIITSDPRPEFSFKGSVGYGNYDTVEAGGYVTGGLSDSLAADLSVYYKDQGKGFGRYIVAGGDANKRKDFAVRSKWKFDASDRDTFTLILAHSEHRSDGEPFNVLPGYRVVSPINTGSVYAGRNNSVSTSPQLNNVDSYSFGLRYEHKFDFATFISSTGTNRTAVHYLLDTDLSPQRLIEGEVRAHSHSYTQEFQLLGEPGGRLNWQAGVFLFRNSGKYDLTVTGDILTFSGLSSTSRIFTHTTPRTDSIAGYAQASYKLTDAFKVTGGIRYTKDWQTVKGNGFLVGVVQTIPDTVKKQSAGKPSWRMSLDYTFAPDILGYVSWNRGFKSGGFGSTNVTGSGFRPETIDAYEVGLKTELMNHRVRFNIASFFYKYKDIQVQVVNPDGITTSTFNAAAAHIKGIDIDLAVVPFRNFTVTGGLGILDSTYKQFLRAPVYDLAGNVSIDPDAAGNRTPNAPKFTGSAAAAYTLPTDIGNFELSGTVIHKGKSYVSPDNALPFRAYTLVNGNLSWKTTDERMGVSLWVKNLTNANYSKILFESSVAFGQVEGDPRTYGVSVNWKL